MSTVAEIIELANSRSMKNKPGVIATDSEMLEVVVKVQRKLFAVSARINPSFFGVSEGVSFLLGWARPTAAELIHRIEAAADTVDGSGAAIATGTEIAVVPFDDRAAERYKPAVYRFGQVFQSVGETIDPASGDLTFFYSKRPSDPASVGANLDTMWPEQYDELLAVEAAMYLAVKDSVSQRGDEFAALRAERDELLRAYVMFLEHETANESRRWGQLRRFNSAQLVPLSRYFAGGTEVFGAQA